MLPGRVRASESLVGRSGGDGVRLRKGRGVLRQPVCTPTPEPTAVIRGETKERKNREKEREEKKRNYNLSGLVLSCCLGERKN